MMLIYDSITRRKGAVAVKMKIMLAMLAMLCVIGVASGCSQKDNASSSVSIKTVASNSSSAAIEIQEKYPQISGMSDSKIQKTINEEISTAINGFIKESEKTAVKDYKDYLVSKPDYPWRQYSAATDFTLRSSKGAILSLTADQYSFTGGAHGGTYRVAYNYDVATGKRLIKLSELFKDNSDYASIINKAIKNEIAKHPQDFFDKKTSGIDGFTAINDKTSFCIEPGNLVVFFSQYEISPYSTGIPEFKVPYTALKNISKYQF